MALLELLMPPACAGCGRSGALLCPACRTAFQVPSRPADRFLTPDPGVVVGESLALAMAAFAYEGPLRRSLASLKYSGTSRLAPILAVAAEPALRRLLSVSGPATLTPVPLHLERRRARGYNQALLMAAQLARLSEMPVAELLIRVRPTTKQHRLNRAARLHNLRGAFAVTRGAVVPRRVIVVDDIITTNATLEACASVLVAAGCEAGYGFAVAREV